MQFHLVCTSQSYSSSTVKRCSTLLIAPHVTGESTSSTDWCIFFKPNREISGVLVSMKDSPEKPDPTRIIADSDMNTFTPVTLENDFSKYAPADFLAGWREYRIPVRLPDTLPEGQLQVLEIQAVLCSRAEFYLDGVLLHGEDPAPQSAVTVPLKTNGRREFEVRALFKACEGDSPANGISGGILLSLADE